MKTKIKDIILKTLFCGKYAMTLFAAIMLVLLFTFGSTVTPAAQNDVESKRMERWHKSEIKEFNDDTFKPSKENAHITSKFVRFEVGKSHEGVKYYLEYIDNNNFYVTFDNSKNTYGRQIELFIYDKTLPNKKGEDWSLYRADYYIAPFEKVTKQYKINGGIKEKKPLEFGISIFDKGFKYYFGIADVLKKSKAYDLDITYYGIDNTVEYLDISGKTVTEKLPSGFCNIK